MFLHSWLLSGQPLLVVLKSNSARDSRGFDLLVVSQIVGLEKFAAMTPKRAPLQEFQLDLEIVNPPFRLSLLYSQLKATKYACRQYWRLRKLLLLLSAESLIILFTVLYDRLLHLIDIVHGV